MLTWALLDQPQPDLDAALQTLQWTQITGSAQALAQMQQRLSAKDATLSSLIRQAQGIQLQQTRLRSDLLTAYAGGGGDVAACGRRQRPCSPRCSAATPPLLRPGMEMTGQASVTPVTLTDLQSLLAQDEVLVTFVLPGLRPDVVPGLAGSSNFALAVTRDAVTTARIPEPGRGALSARIAAFRCQIALNEPGCNAGASVEAQRGAMVLDAEPRDGFDPAPARDLYRDLFGGLAPALQGKAHLIIIPPADLLRLPFQALLTDDTPSPLPWLIRRHSVSVLPSIPSFATLRRAPPTTTTPRLLAVGNPILAPTATPDCTALNLPRAMPPHKAGSTPSGLADPALLRALPSLPDSGCEIIALASSFGTQSTLLQSGDATETRLKAMANDLPTYDTLVFATHGLLAGEAGSVEPGLVLTPPQKATPEDDGLLTASEIASLTLSARLVILSACNTAAGDGASRDGLAGLARAFFQAGARQVLVTHWSVYSSAATLVSTGYMAQAKPRQRPSETLRQVLLTMADSPDPTQSDPAFWAAFAMVGAD